jgi:hypothetical protein
MPRGPSGRPAPGAAAGHVGTNLAGELDVRRGTRMTAGGDRDQAPRGPQQLGEAVGRSGPRTVELDLDLGDAIGDGEGQQTPDRLTRIANDERGPPIPVRTQSKEEPEPAAVDETHPGEIEEEWGPIPVGFDEFLQLGDRQDVQVSLDAKTAPGQRRDVEVPQRQLLPASETKLVPPD